MKLQSAFLTLFLFGLLVETCEGKEVFDHRNLEGLKKINEIMFVNIRVSGDEPFDLEESKVKQIVRKKLREAKIQIDSTNKANANITVRIHGETTGGGGARLLIYLVLHSRVPSPFGEQITIPVIIWSAEKQDEQVMSYDPDKKKLIKVQGKLRIGEKIDSHFRKFDRIVPFRKSIVLLGGGLLYFFV